MSGLAIANARMCAESLQPISLLHLCPHMIRRIEQIFFLRKGPHRGYSFCPALRGATTEQIRNGGLELRTIPRIEDRVHALNPLVSLPISPFKNSSRRLAATCLR